MEALAPRTGGHPGTYHPEGVGTPSMNWGQQTGDRELGTGTGDLGQGTGGNWGAANWGQGISDRGGGMAQGLRWA